MAGAAISSDAVMRDVVIGKNSAVWRLLSAQAKVAQHVMLALSHRDVAAFPFEAGDRVWVLSYSRNSSENARLLDRLKTTGVRHVIYFSSATTNIMSLTRCYEYPRVKALAAAHAQRELGATIVLLGFVYQSLSDVPAGRCSVVSVEELANLMCNPPAEHGVINLFRMIDTPFGSFSEKFAHQLYDLTQRAAGSFPCVLRPVDIVLRAIGWRWYGYLNLSNRLWSSTRSS